MRIVFLNSWTPDVHEGSGTAVGISNLRTALTRLGHRVEMVRPTNGGASTSLLSRLRFNLGVPRRISAAALPDLVVGFDLDGFRWASARPRSCPYVVCLKGVAADEAEHSRTAWEGAQLFTLASLEARNVRGADGVVVPSAYSAEVTRTAYGVPPDRTRVVPEAIDLERLRRLRTSRPGGARRPDTGRPVTILSVARQYPRKDTATLLRAFAHVRQTHPTARLRVIGGGPELPRLRRLARRLKVASAVLFEGSVPEDERVQQAYAEADMFCLPSRQEGFGIAFVEAMSAGLPVVAARAGAVPEVVRHGETGLLVPPGDVPALARALVRLLGDPVERSRLGEAGIRAAYTYGLEPVGRLFLEAVRELVSPAVDAAREPAACVLSPTPRSRPSSR